MSVLTNNRVQLLGFLGQEVELREFAEGNKLARLRLATDEFKKSSNGQTEKITTWHNLIGWGQTAQQMSEILRKGQKVFVEGKIVYRQYETKTGEKKSQTEIVVSSFKKLEKDETMPVEKASPEMAF
jgi:single-strand DNA-binding protein